MTFSPATIVYKRGNDLDLETVIELYHASTLGQRRPIDNRACVVQMIEHANLVISAWDGELLVGIARSFTDFCYVAYLADLAVRQSHQQQGIGKELIRHTQAALGPAARIVLLAAPAAETYYPHLGFTHHPQAWILGARDNVVE